MIPRFSPCSRALIGGIRMTDEAALMCAAVIIIFLLWTLTSLCSSSETRSRLPREAKTKAFAAITEQCQNFLNETVSRIWRPSLPRLWRARRLLIQIRICGNICPYTRETLYEGDVDELENLLRQGIVPKGLFDGIHLDHFGKGWSYDVRWGVRVLTVESYLAGGDGAGFVGSMYNIWRTQDTPASVPINNVVPVEWRHCVKEWPWVAPPARFKEIWERYVETGELPSPPASCRTRLF